MLGKGYSAIADVYDRLMTDFDYDGYYNATGSYIRGDAVELAIGSAEFTLKYLRRINRLVGVELSTEMLNIAAAKLTKYRSKTTILHDDMMKFKPLFLADTVLCVCDGVNYIKDFDGLLGNVNGYLKTGGYFIFDISSEYKLKDIIGNNIFYEDLDDLTYIWTNKLVGNRVDMDITVFTPSGELYERHDESQSQYIHAHDGIMASLKSLGFEVKVLDGENYGDAREKSRRILYICRKLLGNKD